MLRIALESHPGCEVRSWRESDVPALARHANSPKVASELRDRFPSPYGIDDARTFIAFARRQDPPTQLAIAVEDEAVGGIGFTPHADIERVTAEIGYWLGEEFWGRGITTAAVRALTAHAVRTAGLTRVYAVPFARNGASRRVLEKAGYALEGILRRSAIKDGRIEDQALYAYVVEERGCAEARAPA